MTKAGYKAVVSYCIAIDIVSKFVEAFQIRHQNRTRPHVFHFLWYSFIFLKVITLLSLCVFQPSLQSTDFIPKGV